ncbi:transcriptional regulator, partial [Burkholderia multivorans]
MKTKARTSAAAQAKRTSGRPAASAVSLKSEQASLIEQVQ